MNIVLRLAWRNIWRQPRRTCLTTGAMVFSNVLLIFMISLQFAMYRLMIDNSLQAFTGHMQIQAPGYIDDETMRFLDVFLLFCLFEDSPPDTPDESAEHAHNQLLVVEEGRRPGLTLVGQGRGQRLSTWSTELLDRVQPIAELLDSAGNTRSHGEAVASQVAKVENPDATPSARVLERLRSDGIPFFRFAMDQSTTHRDYFRSRPLSDQRENEFRRMGEASLEEQKRLEGADSLSFDEHIERYLSQDLQVPQNRTQQAS